MMEGTGKCEGALVARMKCETETSKLRGWWLLGVLCRALCLTPTHPDSHRLQNAQWVDVLNTNALRAFNWGVVFSSERQALATCHVSLLPLPNGKPPSPPKNRLVIWSWMLLFFAVLHSVRLHSHFPNTSRRYFEPTGEKTEG